MARNRLVVGAVAVVGWLALAGTAGASHYAGNNGGGGGGGGGARSENVTRGDVLSETITAPAETAGGEAAAEVEAQPTSSSGGALPFTGSDVFQLAAVGGGLVAVGAGLQRYRRRPTLA